MAQASGTVSLLHKGQGDAYGKVLEVQWEKNVDKELKGRVPTLGYHQGVM